MKISKLFHWLYAIVMLLPVFAIGVTCGYAMFNKNAYQSYSGAKLSEVEYTQNNFNDIELGKEYVFTTDELLTFANDNYSRINIDVDGIKLNNIERDVNQLSILYGSNGFRIQTYGNYQSDTYSSQSLIKIEYTPLAITQNGTIQTIANQYNFKVNYSTNHYIDNVFYYAVDKVTESPLFSWAYDSFLVAPFSYIVALFGMPTNHVVVQLLSYWLAISIIWLVFDLVMYVPLLVHRWLDKGVLE